MTNEIKEILEFKENADYKRLSVDEIVILEKYISNLHEDLANYVNVVLHNRKVIDNLQQQIDKGIKYNKEIKNKIEKQLDNGQSYDFIVAEYLAIFHDTLEEILRGDE